MLDFTGNPRNIRSTTTKTIYVKPELRKIGQIGIINI